MAKQAQFTKYAGKEKKHIPEDVTFEVDNVPETLTEAIAWNEGGEAGVFNNYMAHVAVMANAAFMGEYKAELKAGKSHSEAVQLAQAAMLSWRASIGEAKRADPVKAIGKALSGKRVTADQIRAAQALIAQRATALGLDVSSLGNGEGKPGKARKSA